MGQSGKHKKQQARESTASARRAEPNSSSRSDSVLLVDLRQAILDVFGIAFSVSQDVEQTKLMIQEVKGHLYNRDFAAAFGKGPYLQVYALRWSAARALGYFDIFTRPSCSKWLTPVQDPEARERVVARKAVEESESALAADNSFLSERETDKFAPSAADASRVLKQTQDLTVPLQESRTTKVVCIGGGAGAEVVALAAAANRWQQLGWSRTLDIRAIDIADWAQELSQLASALSTTPPISAYASEAVQARNRALVQDATQVQVRFHRQDVLDWDDGAPEFGLREIMSGARLCTIMFTLNELFSSSLPKTTAFLLKLTDAMDRGSWLVVVDSPGSYSEIKMGKEGQVKQYPMKWLLDHTLLKVAGSETDAKWVKTESEDSVWFRLDQSKLRYPAADLENMRYQIHVYEKQ